MNGWDHLSTYVLILTLNSASPCFEYITSLSPLYFHHRHLDLLSCYCEILVVASCLRSLYSWIWFISCFLRSHSVLNQRSKFTLWSFELWIKEIKFEALSFESKIKFHTLKLWALNQRSKSTLWNLSLFSLHSTLPFWF